MQLLDTVYRLLEPNKDSTEYVYPAVAVDPIIALGDREPLFPLSMV